MEYGAWENTPSVTDNLHQYNGKELNTDFGLNWNDYGARFYDPATARWNSIDPMSEFTDHLSPYNYVRNNPATRLDPDGDWDITVHAFNRRDINGYGIAVVTDRNGTEIMRFEVRLEGTGGRNRMKENADTPLGVYDIPDNSSDFWISGGYRPSYGPNKRLSLDGKSGEIKRSGRSRIRIHGGRQEHLVNGRWVADVRPKLQSTHGCLRAYERDMVRFNELIDGLMKNDPKEYGGELRIIDDLQYSPGPLRGGNYYIPSEAPHSLFNLDGGSSLNEIMELLKSKQNSRNYEKEQENKQIEKKGV